MVTLLESKNIIYSKDVKFFEQLNVTDGMNELEIR